MEWTPLHRAVTTGHGPMMLFLLERGANPGNSVLKLALEADEPFAAKLLRAAGAAVNCAQDSANVSMAHILQMDRIGAAAEIGHLGLLQRAIDALEPTEKAERLRTAAQRAIECDLPDTAAFLRSILASDAMDAFVGNASI